MKKNNHSKKQQNNAELNHKIDECITRLTEEEKTPAYIAFPIEQFASVLDALHVNLSNDDAEPYTVGFNVGTAHEIVSELNRAVREAYTHFSPNPKDNPNRVVLIRDMAPIV